tara:strand:+ start:92 stop:322 length:231 start_codon:yes stop_codon:yes gene_type:complete
MKKKKENKSFEQSLDRLEKLVSKMESGDIALEKSMELFEEGMNLINDCQSQLNKADQRIQKFIDQNEAIDNENKSK